jgi:hypothetical protein
VSSLAHLLDHADKMKEEALAKKGETKKGKLKFRPAAASDPLFSRRNT